MSGDFDMRYEQALNAAAGDCERNVVLYDEAIVFDVPSGEATYMRGDAVKNLVRYVAVIGVHTSISPSYVD
jgi:hypothetical protein